MPLAIAQQYIREAVQSTVLIFVDHRELEPQPVLRGNRYERNASSRVVEPPHQLVQGKLEGIDGGRMEHMRVVYRLDVISMRFGQAWHKRT